MAPSTADRRTATLAAGILAALAYANTLGHGFVWDDPISLERWLPALPTAWSAFFPPPGIPQFPPDYYRPLQLLSYRLDRAIGGGAPWPFHLSVVLSHGLATVLVFVTGLGLLERIGGGWWGALWAAAFFAVHPIHSESVAWMAARPDVMVTCFGLAALLAYWHEGWTERRRSAVAATLLLAALLCKENAAALLVLVPLSPAILGSRASRPRAARDAMRRSATSRLATLLPFVTAGLLYLLLRSIALGRVLPAATSPRPDLPAALVSAVGTYLRLLVVPYPQNAYITDLPAGGAALAAGALAVLGFALLLVWAWRREDRPLSFALIWSALTLAPSLVLVADSSGAPLAERYLYLPSVGFCWAVGALLARAREHGRALRFVTHAGAGVLVIAGLALTLQRNGVWHDNEILWSDTAAKSTADGLPLRNLATAILARGDAGRAERLFHEALGRRNDTYGRYTIYNNLGTIALNRGDEVTAERHYRMALSLQPTADCLYNLGLIALRRALSAERTPDAAAREAEARAARGLLAKAVAASPHDADIHVALGQAAEALGDAPPARRHFEEALRLGLPPPTEAAVRRLISGSGS